MVQIASITGAVSVIASFCAGAHQFYLGYLFEGADGFSPTLLTGWLLGDVCNLIGTFWTHQLMFQRVIAMASTFNDVLLTCQHFYYKHKHEKLKRLPYTPEERPGRFLAVQWNAWLRPYILFTLVSAARAHSSIPEEEEEIDWEFIIGQCMAWVAEISYALALVPQAIDNFQRKSTGSVSVTIFLADALSSLNYLATIMLTMAAKSSHRKRVAFVLEELPYIFGTGACALFDFILLAQYYWYPTFVIEVIPDEDNHHTNENTPLMPALSRQNSHTYHSLVPQSSTSSYHYAIHFPDHEENNDSHAAERS